jgi:hypothetical protein
VPRRNKTGQTRTLKMVMKPSVWSKTRITRARSQRSVAIFSTSECTRYGYAVAISRFGRRSALPGAQPSSYRTKGSSCEHGNLDPSAGNANSGKPTGPATSRTRDGASVVVRARENRAHGEGRQ